MQSSFIQLAPHFTVVDIWIGFGTDFISVAWVRILFGSFVFWIAERVQK